MCVIIYKPENIKISRRTIENCFSHNPDGVGLAYYDDEKIEVIKGLFSVSDVLATLKEVSYEDREMIIHFRYATSGDINKKQCHPFGVSNKNQELIYAQNMESVLFHNGVLSEFAYDKKRSDTAMFVKNVLSRINNTYDRLALLETIAGKYALFADGMIHLVGEYTEHKGCMFSNLHWQCSWYESDKYSPAISEEEYIELCNEEEIEDGEMLLDSEGYPILTDEEIELWEEYEEQQALKQGKKYIRSF